MRLIQKKIEDNKNNLEEIDRTRAYQRSLDKNPLITNTNTNDNDNVKGSKSKEKFKSIYLHDYKYNNMLKQSKDAKVKEIHLKDKENEKKISYFTNTNHMNKSLNPNLNSLRISIDLVR